MKGMVVAHYVIGVPTDDGTVMGERFFISDTHFGS